MRRSLLLPLLAYASTAVADPVSFTHSARLVDGAGAPISGPLVVEVALVDGVNSVWSDTFQVLATDGYVTVSLSDIDEGLIQPGLRIRTTAGALASVELPLHPVPSAAATGRVEGGSVWATDLTIEGGLALGAVEDCTTAGVLAWDDAENAVKVCDGSSWTLLHVD